MAVVWVNHYFSIVLLRSKFLLFLSVAVLTVFLHVLQCRDEILFFIIQLKTPTCFFTVRIIFKQIRTGMNVG